MTPRQQTLAIIEAIADEHRIPLAKVMQTGCRSWPVVRARHAAIRAIAELRPHYYTTQIAGVFGCHHTSVLHALGRLQRKPKVSA